MITLTSVSKASINSLPLGPRLRRAMREARQTPTTDDDRAAAPTVRLRPTEAHDENQQEQPTPARNYRGYSACRETTQAS